MRTEWIRRRAFTLIELLVVVTIIGILAALVLGVSSYAVQKSDRARAVADLERIKSALEEYRIAYGTYPTNITAAESQHWVKQLWYDPQQVDRKPFLTAKFLTNPSVSTNRYFDPWGNDYRYLRRNTQGNWADRNNSKFGYDLWSLGPKAADDSDDITNWGSGI